MITYSRFIPHPVDLEARADALRALAARTKCLGKRAEYLYIAEVLEHEARIIRAELMGIAA